VTQAPANNSSGSSSFQNSSQEKPLLPDQRRLCILEADWEMGLCRFARDLKKTGIYVRKVAFHAADHFYQLRGIPADPFQGNIDQWEAWLTQYIEDKQINSILVYNDCRRYNQAAIEVMNMRAAAGKIAEVFIVEQGLIRPLHVTAYCPDDFQPSDKAQLKRLSSATAPSIDPH